MKVCLLVAPFQQSEIDCTQRCAGDTSDCDDRRHPDFAGRGAERAGADSRQSCVCAFAAAHQSRVHGRSHAGRPRGEIKEHRIGSEVFGRGNEFDPQADTIVRTQAHRLRAALAAYYSAEGREDPVVIEFAKGSYVPTVRENIPDLRSPIPSSRRRDPTPVRWRIPGRYLPGAWA